jgi:Kef-type K+ transport system membrane component KefB
MVLLATAALVAPIMGYLKLSPVLGFLAAGILLGPTGLGVVADVATTTKLAELGVVFFLFEMGERRFSVMEDFCFGSGCFEEVPTLLLLLAVLFWPLCSALRRHPLGVRRFVFGLIQFCPPHR